VTDPCFNRLQEATIAPQERIMLTAVQSRIAPEMPARPMRLLAIASQDGRTRLERLGRIQHLHVGETLFDEGEDACELFEIVSGMIKLYCLLPDGRRQVIGFLSADRLIGLAASTSYAYTAEALGEVEVRRFARKPFEAILDQEPALLRHLMITASDELAAAQQHLLLLGRKTAIERVASFLLSLAEQSDDPDSIDIPMGRGDIADHLGLTTETVSRSLGLLKSTGFVVFPTARHAKIRRMDSLRAVAEGELPLDAGSAAGFARAQRAVWPA